MALERVTTSHLIASLSHCHFALPPVDRGEGLGTVAEQPGSSHLRMRHPIHCFYTVHSTRPVCSRKSQDSPGQWLPTDATAGAPLFPAPAYEAPTYPVLRP